MNEYKITVTERQADIIIDALDLWSRMHMGQWNEILMFAKNHDCRFEAEKLIDVLRFICGMLPGRSPSGYYGIHSKEISDSARVAWDLQQVIRHRLSWDRDPEGGWTVNFDTPMQSCEEEPLARIEKMEKAEQEANNQLFEERKRRCRQLEKAEEIMADNKDVLERLANEED